MIQANVYEIAAAAAGAVKDATGMSIVPVGNSPLAAMASLTYVASNQPTKDLTYAAMLQAATADDAVAPSDHSASIGIMIDEKIPQVTSHIAFVHGVVNPAVEKFKENYASSLNSILNVSPTSDFNIIQVTIPAAAMEADLIALVSQYADKYAQPPAILGSMPVVSPDVLMKAMSVSSASVNETIRMWIAERGTEWLMSIWEYYFSVPEQGAAVRRHFDGGYLGVAQQGSHRRLDTALAMFLISRGLLDEPLEGVNVDLATWRSTMDKISRFAAHQVLSALELLDDTRNSKTLILSVADQGRTITVDGTLYAAFVEQGGSEKDIIGAALSNRSMYYSLDTLLAQSTEFRAIWDNFEVVSCSTLESKAATQLRAAAVAGFTHLVEYVDQEEGEYLEHIGRNKDAMIRMATEAVQAMNLNDLKDVCKLGICLIAGIRYQHTPAKQFLEDMMKAEEAGCKSPQEAAGMAGMNYICRYVASLLALTR